MELNFEVNECTKFLFLYIIHFTNFIVLLIIACAEMMKPNIYIDSLRGISDIIIMYVMMVINDLMTVLKHIQLCDMLLTPNCQSNLTRTTQRPRFAM